MYMSRDVIQKKTGFVTKVYYSIDSNMDSDIMDVPWQPYRRVYRVFMNMKIIMLKEYKY